MCCSIPRRSRHRSTGCGYKFSQNGLQLTLTTDSKSAYEFELRVAVEDANAERWGTAFACCSIRCAGAHILRLEHWSRFVGVVKGSPVLTAGESRERHRASVRTP